MEFVFALPILLIPFALPLMAGFMARRFGRSFRFWFWISFLLPFVSCIIILCLPDRSIEQRPVENEEIFNQLFLKSAHKIK